MRLLAAYGAIIFAALVIQTTAFNFTFGSPLWPDLTLIIAIHGGLRHGMSGGVRLGAAAGLAEDLLSYGATGANTLTKGLTGFIVGKLRESYINDSNMARGVLAVGATVADHIVYSLVIRTFSDYSALSGSLGALVVAIMMNLAFIFPALRMINRTVEWAGNLWKDDFGGHSKPWGAGL
ncbi:MAG: rod shape-determining protein MreD [Nitrospinae bacterium]|nr:rod shape-determining protein MreD [Nitrospinota bacterium]